MSSAASQLFRMLARNNGAELMIPESNECNDELVAAAHELSKELNIKEVLLKAAMPVHFHKSTCIKGHINFLYYIVII